MIKTIIKKFLKQFGFKIQRIGTPKPLPKQPAIFTMQSALKRCFERGLVVETVIDVGESDGRWTAQCMQVFPDANYLLVEAQEGHKAGLENFVVTQKNTQYILAAAGPKDGKIYFDNGDLFGGVASETPIAENCIEVPVVSLDSEINKKGLKGPYLLKLDTHGFEIPILNGATNIIKNASLIIIETYNFKLNKDSLRYWEMCSYMDSLGFTSIENVDLLLREYDQALWQMDTFYIPKQDKAFSYNSYS